MFAYFLLALAASAAVEPARPATIINGSELGEEDLLSVSALPLEFPDGTATMALDINAKGKMAACQMLAWENGGAVDKAIEDIICTALRRRARFDPALDASGLPIDSLLKIGIDPVLPNEPRLANVAHIFSSDDYPNAALRNGAQGTVTVRLGVDANGKPINCKVLGSSGNAPLDSTTCDIYVERARFDPGKDSAGRPLAGTAIARVRWQLPDKRPFGDMILKNSMTFDADGNTAECKSFWGDSSIKKAACDKLKSIAFKALTPIQRAFRTLSQEQGFVVGPPGVVEQIGKHKGEDRLMLVAALVTVDAQGRVTECQPVDAASKESAVGLCREARETKFLAEDRNKGAAARTAVSYSALILRRPGF